MNILKNIKQEIYIKISLLISWLYVVFPGWRRFLLIHFLNLNSCKLFIFSFLFIMILPKKQKQKMNMATFEGDDQMEYEEPASAAKSRDLKKNPGE